MAGSFNVDVLNKATSPQEIRRILMRIQSRVLEDLGTLGKQDADSVAITGGTIAGLDSLTVTGTTQSTDKDTGCVIVEGGIGIEKNLNVGGALGVVGNSTLTGSLTVNKTTDSTSKDTGAIITEGGAGIEKALYVGTDVGFNGVLKPDGDAGTSGDILVSQGASTTPIWQAPTVDVKHNFDYFNPLPSRSTEDNWNGGLLALDTAGSMSSGVPFVMTTKGSGKIMIVINAGSDVAGDITATGTSVNRSTGALTVSDTSVMTLTGVTTDATTTDANGNTVHSFTKAYITDQWFTGVVTLSTTDVNISDMDTYHVSFEQFGDESNITLNQLDFSIFTTNVNAEFDAYLYSVEVTGDEVDVGLCADVHVGAVGGAKAQTAQANKYFRLKRKGIAKALDGAMDGIFCDISYSNSPAYVEDVTGKIWFTQSIPLTLT